ncbi:MAG: hypothetical protein RL701_5182 [Pseudomonadota bacterium]|jgi:spermidine synthase
MVPWKLVDTAPVPGSRSELRLYQRDAEFSITVDGEELMNSRAYSSEDGFAELGCEAISDRAAPKVLIGGLGLGYSLSAALNKLPQAATVTVAELVPKVAEWNRELLGHLAEHPLRDPRVTLREVDVARVLRESRAAFDLILLDVDNGPEGLTRKSNDYLYSQAGLLTARAALRTRGVLGYWSSGPNEEFVHRMQDVGFEVEEVALRAADGCYGVLHTIWLATAREHA